MRTGTFARCWGSALAGAALVLSSGAVAPAGATDAELTWARTPAPTQLKYPMSVSDCFGNTTFTPGLVSVTELGVTNPSNAEISYEWVAGGEVVETGPDLVLDKAGLARLHGTLVLRSTAAADGFEPAVAVSEPVRIIMAGGGPACAAPVATIMGRARVGSTLKVRYVGPGKASSFSWQRNGKPIMGATKATYRVVAGDAGRRLSVVVVVRKGLGMMVARSTPTARVAR